MIRKLGPALFPLAATLLLMAVAGLVGGVGGLAGIARAGLAFAAFSVLAGLGQMLVITAGSGNIDLSIPSVMTLAGYLAMGQMQGDEAGLPPGLALGMLVGLASGAANAVLILAVRIPPMIATLACGFILESFAVAYSRGSTASPADSLQRFAQGAVLGVPFVAWLALVACVATALLLAFGTFGRAVEAIGQNARAARFAGIRVTPTLVVVYVVSSLLAALTGILYAAYSGGASLGMAQDFLLISIAVVVVGGTDVAGGRASVFGLAAAAAFLYLAVAVLNLLQVSPGLRFVLTGAIIIGVLLLGSRPRPR